MVESREFLVSLLLLLANPENKMNSIPRSAKDSLTEELENIDPSKSKKDLQNLLVNTGLKILGKKIKNGFPLITSSGNNAKIRYQILRK